MKRYWPIAVLLLLSGCAQSPSATLDIEREYQLMQIIHRVAKEQAVTDIKPRSTVVFEVDYQVDTKTLLAAPELMPALLSLQQHELTLLIGVESGHQQLQHLTTAMRLSRQLQDFLQQQQFVVERRLDAEIRRNQIRLVIAAGQEQ